MMTDKGLNLSSEGLQIWRVVKLKMVPLERKDFGTFYTGDAYVILHRGDAETHVHMWHGDNASVDEKGVSAVFVTQIDDLLNGVPVQHREMQGHESDVLMNYFPSGIKYQEGGVDSGFHKVPSAPKLIRKLYHIKGKKDIRAKEVPMSWESFNTGDCFILDLGEKILQWSGIDSNTFERRRAGTFANGIRDQERRGQAEVFIIQDGEEIAEMIEILGPKPVLKPGNLQEDLDADESHSKMALLSKVSDATGSMVLSLISDQSPFSRTLLQSEDCFVLDNGICGKIYIWKGRKANVKEKKSSIVSR